MQFEVNGQTYFLSFAEEEGEWYLLTSTDRGIKNLEIEHDDGPLTDSVIVATEENISKTIN